MCDKNIGGYAFGHPTEEEEEAYIEKMIRSDKEYERRDETGANNDEETEKEKKTRP